MTLEDKQRLEAKMRELPSVITRNKLIDKFANDEDNVLSRTTCKQLIQIAQGLGIEVKNANVYETLKIKKDDIIKELYNKKKLSVAQIAKEMNLTKRQVYKRLKENKVHIRYDDIEAYYNTFTRKEIEDLYKNYRLEEIYEKIGIASRAFYKLLDKFEIKRIGKGKGRGRAA